MTDLHDWITQQIDKAKAVARDAGGAPWHWEHDYGGMCNDQTCPYGELVADYPEGPITVMDVHGYDIHEPWSGAAHIALHDPAAVLRRCAADRKILAEHAAQPDGSGFPDSQQCQTCSQPGGDGYQYLVPYPCPTVRDLAEGYGLEEGQPPQPALRGPNRKA